ncbi:chlorohydrolase [Streptococcus pneumoniae]|uniref:hypothetical protein n=1 Tax=Streptococcus pneumoniae TaxID=1313 RepID=UPI0005E8E4EF|nr:hypothetical protein [Streptococcus pneumoniae]CNA88205.1 chlorohydrolase [Streptococcus pneumoniae]
MELTKSAQNTVLRWQIELTKKVVDGTDEVSSKHCFEVAVTYTYGKVKLTWFEEIFEEYKTEKSKFDSYLDSSQALIFYSLQ